jgi:hypothetical protein
VSDFDLLGAQRRIFASGLRPMERLVALALVDHWSRSSAKPFPGVDRLAEFTGADRKTVLRALAGLEQAGALGVTRRSRGQSNLYDLAPLMVLEPVPQRDQSPSRTSPSPPPEPVPQRDSDQSLSATLRNPLKEPIEGTKRSRARARGRQVALPMEDPEQAKKHQAVTACYFEAFEARRKEKPPFSAREGKAVNDLIRKLQGDAERACGIVRSAYAPENYLGNTASIVTIAADPAKYAGQQSQPARRGVQQPQHGGLDQGLLARARAKGAGK